MFHNRGQGNPDRGYKEAQENSCSENRSREDISREKFIATDAIMQSNFYCTRSIVYRYNCIYYKL
jgi:hypothetical protein